MSVTFALPSAQNVSTFSSSSATHNSTESSKNTLITTTTFVHTKDSRLFPMLHLMMITFSGKSKRNLCSLVYTITITESPLSVQVSLQSFLLSPVLLSGWLCPELLDLMLFQPFSCSVFLFLSLCCLFSLSLPYFYYLLCFFLYFVDTTGTCLSFNGLAFFVTCFPAYSPCFHS